VPPLCTMDAQSHTLNGPLSFCKCMHIQVVCLHPPLQPLTFRPVAAQHSTSKTHWQDQQQQQKTRQQVEMVAAAAAVLCRACLLPTCPVYCHGMMQWCVEVSGAGGFGCVRVARCLLRPAQAVHHRRCIVLVN
jgi:hypothetical protein